MNSYKLYRFTLIPQSAMGTPLVGDSLFGQLCWAIVHQFGQERLRELLKGYTERDPFMVVSDAFPQGYLPLPTLPSSFWQTSETHKANRKRLKKIQWIKWEDAQKNAVALWQECAATHQQEIDDKNEKHKYDPNYKKKAILFKESQDQFHNTIDRQTNTTGDGQFAPYTTDLTWFGKEQKFDLYIVLNEKRFSLEELSQVLNNVGSFGFGRDASIGLGKFRCENPEPVSFTQKNANCYLTLANTAPQGLGLNKDHCYYQITTRFGRHGDRQALSANPFKKPIILAKAAAIFTPKNYQETCLFLGNGLGNISYAQSEAVHQGYAPILNLFVDFEDKDR